MALFTKDEALRYHSSGHPGKVEVVPVKPCTTQKHLSMAYTPGVADVCRAIHADVSLGYDYTNKGNLVAVVSNGTAVLGLGNIGPLAGKPVMEGKGVLFKIFADVDVYDLSIDQKDPKKIIEFVKMLEPTFGGINLEDIKAPECFEVEQTLIEQMDIPVFHDDQHGTAIISGAGLIAALDLTNRKPEDVKLVISGAGAAAIACTRFFESFGVQRKNVYMFDSRGLIHKGRTDLNAQKAEFAQEQDHGSLADVMRGADCFLGLSVGGMVTQDMVRSMAPNPIIFACANPDPEISYEDARAARADVVMATGRSDYPNQINNVLGFPFIFRGALDTRASAINEEMKLAAARALAALARESVPAEVLTAYGISELAFGVDYIIPKALDPRVIEWVAPAVAEAAMRTGVARRQLDLAAYKVELRERMQAARARIGQFIETYGLDF
ncbi:malic enzyme-like NAD(P)-binding protein [Nitratidesulfovibrio liaohensis]|uniref:malic enzyme-like NAD(P)-binding protein n=1 Tax=Nitratidesulfovibrio liaohensis TaxID=2604158 RepID=UPI001421C068|nr:malic enzyme-like NAD(P)-binding protein [Nitratidesulfovibrio liaohensis]NHZ46277.1 malate dehydrogenase [Nitratidesulfovibrio liaohensis]